MKGISPLRIGQDRFADTDKAITRHANANHFADASKMVGSGQSSESSLLLRANGASTLQPRATPWELGHPNIHQP